MARQCRL